MDNISFQAFIVISVICVLTFAVFAGSNVDAGAVAEYARAEGWHSARVTGYSWYGCGQGDWFHTQFTAVGQNGQPISGIICSGLLSEGKTLRLN